MSVITLNVNGLHTPTKGQRITNWIKARHNYMMPAKTNKPKYPPEIQRHRLYYPK